MRGSIPEFPAEEVLALHAPGPLHVIALLRARPGCEDELRTLARSLLAPTRAERGCLRYVLVEDPADPSLLTFVEEWEDEAALEAHLRTPHLEHAKARYEVLLAGPLDLRRGYEHRG